MCCCAMPNFCPITIAFFKVWKVKMILVTLAFCGFFHAQFII